MADDKDRRQVKIKMDRVASKILGLIAQERVAVGEVGDLLEAVKAKLTTMPIAGPSRGRPRRTIGNRGRRKAAAAS